MSPDVEAPIDFIVLSFTPIDIDKEKEIEITGSNLNKVTGAVCPVAGNSIELEFTVNSSDSLTVKLSDDIPNLSLFNILLTGSSGSWFPVGPLIKRTGKAAAHNKLADLCYNMSKQERREFTEEELTDVRNTLAELGFKL